MKNKLRYTLLGIPIFAVFLFIVFISYRLYRANQSDLQEIKISISKKNWDKLEKKRIDVLEHNKIKKTHKKYYPALISIDNGDDKKIKLRLKGDKLDHYISSPPSFRIKTKNDLKLFGTNKFSIQAFTCRNFQREWVFHKLLASEDILSLNMDIINLKINDTSLITTFEEHFTHHLTDRFKRPRGAIIGVSEQLFWDKYEGLTTPENEENLYLNSPIKIFDNGKTTDTIEINNGISLLDDFRKKRKSVDEVFNIKQIAMYYALCELASTSHALRWHNIRYYYNPNTKKLEPIGFDAHIKSVKREFIYDQNFINHFTKDKFFKNSIFLKEYFKCLKLVSSDKYIDSFISKYENEIYEIFNKTYKQNLFHPKGLGALYRKADWIRDNIDEFEKKMIITSK